MIGEQIALPVHLRDYAELDQFHPGPNAEALAAVRHCAAGEQPRRLLLHGPAGSGRTHLLQAAVRASAGSGRRCAYLSLASHAESPEILDGLASLQLIALDDLDEVLTARDWAVALARLLDGLRLADAAVLLAASQPPEHLDIALPDLRTRLGTCAVYPLKPLGDADRRALLQQRAKARGLEMSDEVADYLVRRLPRNAASLMQALDTLDRASLTAQRRLTLPFVQATLPALAPTSARTAPD